VARRDMEEEKEAKEGYVYKTAKSRVQHASKVIQNVNIAVSQFIVAYIRVE
jgi:hypothetical protein